MSEKRLIFIYNPVSGKGKIQSKLAAIIEIFIKHKYIVEVKPTQKSGDARDFVVNLESENYDLIVCAGGDGTLDEVVNGMMSRDINDRLPIGYIPLGSTNDFASSLYISKKPTVAAHNAIEGYPFKCDIGKIADINFVYVAAFGAFTAVSYETGQNLKNILGHFAYILQGAKSIIDIKAYNMRFDIDGEIIEDKFIFGMITNSRSVGGFKGIINNADKVAFDDGVFEITLIKKPKTLIGVNAIIASLLGKNVKSKYVINKVARKVSIVSDEEISWTVDGENGGNYKEATVECLQRQVRIKIPEKKVEELSVNLKKRKLV